MRTLTERPARKLEDGAIRRSDPRIIPLVKVQLRQEWDDGKGPSRVTSSVTGLTAKVTAGFSWLYKLLAGPPMSERGRLRYATTVAKVEKHKAMAAYWAHQPTRGIF